MNANFFRYIITNEPEKTLNEQHIFNLFVFLVSILFFVATLINYLSNLGIVTMVSLAGGILLSSIYIITRFYVYNQKVVILFILLSIISLNGLFLTNFGYKGPIVYNFLTLGMAILFFLDKKSRLPFIIILLANLIGLAIIEYFFPTYFGNYENESIRVFDHAVNITFSLVTLALLFYLMLEYIESQKLKAEESDRLKSSFLANMSHEIRTPLNGIVGFSSLLNDKHLSTKDLDHFTEIIQSNSHHLAGLINDLIDVSTIEANAVDLTFAPINLNALMDQTLRKFQTMISAKQKDIYIYHSLGIQLGESTLFVDKVRLGQVINNLIINAINHSGSESIHFGYILTHNDKHLQFFVKDQGIGISAEDQDLIFKPFLKTKSANYTSMGGTGVGLTIANKLVEIMGGRMGIESQLNEGTNFYFTIPYYKNLIDVPSEKLV